MNEKSTADVRLLTAAANVPMMPMVLMVRIVAMVNTDLGIPAASIYKSVLDLLSDPWAAHRLRNYQLDGSLIAFSPFRRGVNFISFHNSKLNLIN